MLHLIVQSLCFRGAGVKGQLLFSVLIHPVRIKPTNQQLEVLKVPEDPGLGVRGGGWLVTGVNMGIVRRRGRGGEGMYLVKAGEMSCRRTLSIYNQGLV